MEMGLLQGNAMQCEVFFDIISDLLTLGAPWLSLLVPGHFLPQQRWWSPFKRLTRIVAEIGGGK
jgi:hypothetical protein